MLGYSNRSFTAVEQKVAAEALGAAFSKDPFMTYVFPDATTRTQNLANIFQPILRCSTRYGGVEIAPDGRGALAWLPGEYFPLRLPQLVRSGMVWTPLLMGLSAFDRLQIHETACEHELIERAPHGFAYLWLLGVDPKAAGHGLGKQMVRAALSKMRHRGHSTCLLRTDNEHNVPLYEHLGFHTIHTDTVSGSQLNYWVLSQDLN